MRVLNAKSHYLKHFRALLDYRARFGFLGSGAARSYMKAHCKFVEALLKIKTPVATEKALQNLLAMLEVDGANGVVNTMVPAHMIRLGMDQEAYNFVKWWRFKACDPNYYAGNALPPHIKVDLKDANKWEDPQTLGSYNWNLTHLATTTLIKIKLLFKLYALEENQNSDRWLSQDLLKDLRYGLDIPVICCGEAYAIPAQEHAALAERLIKQIESLMAQMDKDSRSFWPALLDPGQHLNTQRTGKRSLRFIERMQQALQWTYDGWNETPGAIDYVKERLQAKT
jgi:hypothetical protein